LLVGTTRSYHEPDWVSLVSWGDDGEFVHGLRFAFSLISGV